MDQTNQPIQTSNLVTDDYLVTKKVDPSTLPTNQVNTDLDALKKAEAFMTGRLSTKATLNNPISNREGLTKQKSISPPLKQVADNDKDQVLRALSLKNPFKGE